MNSFTKLVWAAFITLLIISCEEKKPDLRLEQPEAFKKVLDAHGNWSKWVNSEAFSFTMFHETNLTQENYFINLDSREVRIDGQFFQIGYDGEKTWISPNRQAFGGPSVKFYQDFYFYFFAMPYILTDMKAEVVKVENQKLNGKDYEAFDATFESGYHSGPSNQYTLLVDPETRKLEWVLYKVTFFNNPNPPLQAMKYEDYRDAGGLIFPRVITGYSIAGDSTERFRSQVSFADVVLTEDIFDQDLFEMPEKLAVVAN
ncbi:hypothetical protein [Algoriphagus limi]|uniref:Outer membrane lipoprotein-sorting protein n=1 Tax=Algoriphagus limi TaxID=2975273 RepID=A0ABT2G425_9BACT|nr:hypothetical protein [Algoriphagus limi]MCS5490022.1 hypothetical protein [Algoriphagus limi]